MCVPTFELDLLVTGAPRYLLSGTAFRMQLVSLPSSQEGQGTKRQAFAKASVDPARWSSSSVPDAYQLISEEEPFLHPEGRDGESPGRALDPE